MGIKRSITMAGPLIPIKKPDGSVVKVTFEEFQKIKAAGPTKPAVPVSDTPASPVTSTTKAEPTAASEEDLDISEQDIADVKVLSEMPIPPPPKEIEEEEFADISDLLSKPIPPPPPAIKQVAPTSKPKKVTDVKKPIRTDLATTSPVTNIFVDEAAATLHDWDDDDHVSPLEMSIHHNEEVDETLPALPAKRDKVVPEVLNKLSFQISEDLHARLSSLIQSRLKEIRHDDQVVAYAVKSVETGGFGLAKEQASELLDAILDALHIPHDEAPLPSKPQTLPTKTIAIKPPVKKAPTPAPAPGQAVNPLPRPTPLSTEAKPFMQDMYSPKKPVVADPVRESIRPESIGPVDQIRMFNVTDFRRLADTPEKMKNQLLQKFKILKGESYMLYIDAVHAWYQSPLYTRYQAILLEAINAKAPVKDSIEKQRDKGITMEEFTQIATIGKAVRF
jgi:hypothetical protein